MASQLWKFMGLKRKARGENTRFPLTKQAPGIYTPSSNISLILFYFIPLKEIALYERVYTSNILAAVVLT